MRSQIWDASHITRTGFSAQRFSLRIFASVLPANFLFICLAISATDFHRELHHIHFGAAVPQEFHNSRKCNGLGWLLRVSSMSFPLRTVLFCACSGWLLWKAKMVQTVSKSLEDHGFVSYYWPKCRAQPSSTRTGCSTPASGWFGALDYLLVWQVQLLCSDSSQRPLLPSNWSWNLKKYDFVK